MMNLYNSKSISSNLVWHFAEKWLCQIISFVVSIVIARILDPSVYAPVVIINAFTSIFSVFLDGGLEVGLVQKKNVDDLDYSTVFVSNIILCSFIYFIIYICAPFVAKFYNISSIEPLIRVAALTIIIAALKSVQQSYISRNMMFRKFFFASLFGTLGSGIVGVWMALKGYGAWALVISSLFDVFVDTICIWISLKWKPSFKFSKERFKPLFDFSWKVLLTSLIDRVYNKMYHFVIGKVYTSEDLAYYDKGNSLTSKIADNTTRIVGAVIFPAMAKKQDDISELKKLTKKVLVTNMYIMTPLLIGMAVVAKPLVCVLLTDKWLFSVPYIQAFCIVNIIMPINNINVDVIRSLGRSDVYLKQETIKKIIGVLILIITVKISPLAIAIGRIFLYCIYVIISSIKTKEFIDYGLLEQIKDVIPPMIISFIMSIFVYFISLLNINDVVLLISQIICGMIIYIFILIVTKNETFYYLINKLLSILKK